MYKFLIASVVALLVIQGIVCKPSAKPKADSTIDDLAKNAQNLVRNVSQAIDGQLPDASKVAQTLTETSQQLASKVKEVVDNLNSQAQEHKGDVEQVIAQIKTSLTNTAQKLQAAIGPEAVNKAKELKSNLDEGLNKAIAQAQNLAKAAEPEAEKVKTDLTNTAKTLLDQIVQISKNLKTELEKNVAQS